MSKTLTDEAKSLIETLYKPVSFWQRSSRDKLSTLELISRTGDPAAIPDLANLLFDSSRSVMQATADTMLVLSKSLRPSDMPWLDELMRERSPYRWSYPSAWADLKPDQLSRLKGLGSASVIAIGLASFHSSGYVREKALRLLSDVHDGTELPFALLRLNDWVANVRDTAKQLIHSRLTSSYAPLFVSNLVLVSRLRISARARAQQLEVVELIEEFFKSAENRRALHCGFDSADHQARRWSYELALKSAELDRPLVIQKSISDSDPVIRLWGTEEIARLSDAPLMNSLLIRAMSDHSGPIRKKAIEIISNRFADLANGWLERALLDAHRSVREYAQFSLFAKPNFDVKAFYVDALTKPRTAKLSYIILGLGEVGERSDASLAVPYVFHAEPRVRRAAFRTLTRLGSDDVEIFLKGISDPSPSVSREAMKAVGKRLPMIEGENLWRIFATSTELHVRSNVLFLLARLSKWESIGYVLEALRVADENLKNIAAVYVRRWLVESNKTFTSPRQPQITRLREALDRTGSTLDASVKEQLRFAMKGL